MIPRQGVVQLPMNKKFENLIVQIDKLWTKGKPAKKPTPKIAGFPPTHVLLPFPTTPRQDSACVELQSLVEHKGFPDKPYDIRYGHVSIVPPAQLGWASWLLKTMEQICTHASMIDHFAVHE